MTTPLSIREYTPAPRLDAAGAQALGLALVAAVPAEAPEAVTAPAADIEVQVVGLQDACDARDDPGELVRPHDERLDNAWAALHGGLQSAARLPGGRKRSVLAGQLLPLLFPDGLRFLKDRHEKEWAESNKRLRKISDEGLEGSIAEAVGPDYLEEVQASHDAYASAMNITEPADQPPRKIDLRDNLRQVGDAIEAYALQVVAWGNQGRGKNLEAARLALAPIDKVRSAERSSGTSSDRKADEKEPVADAPTSQQTPASSKEGTDVAEEPPSVAPQSAPDRKDS